MEIGEQCLNVCVCVREGLHSWLKTWYFWLTLKADSRPTQWSLTPRPRRPCPRHLAQIENNSDAIAEGAAGIFTHSP